MRSHDPPQEDSDTYMSSKTWISRYGLKAKKLTMFDALATVAFKHRDGVVNLKVPPEDRLQADAVSTL